MSKSVEFFFDVGSPTVYLAATQLSKIAGRHGATVLWRPFLLGGVLRDATKYHSFLIHSFR